MRSVATVLVTTLLLLGTAPHTQATFDVASVTADTDAAWPPRINAAVRTVAAQHRDA